jgi:hypothetical protein
MPFPYLGRLPLGLGKEGLDDELQSFTTFHLPFRYRITAGQDVQSIGQHEWAYRSVDQNSQSDAAADLWRERRRYFTPETMRPLYQYARWMRLSDGTDASGKWKTVLWTRTRESGNSDTIALVVHRPEIVLFEYPISTAEAEGQDVECPTSKAEAEGHDELLRTGMLLLTVTFCTPKPGCGIPVYDDLLDLNDSVRYLRADNPDFFAVHEQRLALLRGGYDARTGTVRAGFWSQVLGALPATSPPHHEWGRDLFEGWNALLSLPTVLQEPKWRFQLAGTSNDSWNVLIGDEGAAHPRSWLAYADHRAFTLTSAVVPVGPEDFAPERIESVSRTRSWRRLLNVDLSNRADASPPTRARYLPARPGYFCARLRRFNAAKPVHAQQPIGDAPESPDDNYSADWCTRHTYSRWSHFGTVYGFCGHAGAVLFLERDFKSNFLTARNFGVIYRDMILLLLYTRVTIFRLSDTLASLARTRLEQTGSAAAVHLTASDKLRNLRRVLEYFTNVYRFPLLSNQQQGVEMFALARHAMDIEELVQEVREQIDTTDAMENAQSSTAAAVSQVTLADNSATLSKVATLGLALSVAIALASLGPGSGLVGLVHQGVWSCTEGYLTCNVLNGLASIGIVLLLTVLVILSMKLVAKPPLKHLIQSLNSSILRKAVSSDDTGKGNLSAADSQSKSSTT